MFKDKKEELRRLEAELLRETELEEAESRLAQELEEAQALLDTDDEDDFGEESEETYHNFANRYGTLDAYNSDTTDEDLDAYSDRVYRSDDRRAIRALSFLAVCLLLGILAVLGWFAVKYMGILS